MISRPSKKAPSSQLLRVIALTLITAYFSLFSAGCTEELEEQNGVAGQEANINDIAKAFADATEGVSIVNAKPNQSVFYEVNYRIETTAVMMDHTMARTLDHVDTESNVDNDIYVLRETVTPYSRSGVPETPMESQVDILVPKNVLSVAQKIRGYLTEPGDCDGVDHRDDEGDVYDCVKFFNLKYNAREIPVPRDVKRKENCMGFASCTMPVNFLSFDVVKWSKGKSIRRLTQELYISKDVPDFLGDRIYQLPPITSLCIRGLMAFKEVEHDVYVTQCMVLRDFSL